MEACPFCEISAGRIDQEVVYADDTVIAFLCEPPATWGHTLITSRAHRQDIWTVDPPEAQAAMALAQRVAHVLRDDLGAVGVNLRQNSGSRAGQDVFHFHVHVVPRYKDDTVLPGCVWGMPPWQPPAGGDPRTPARGRGAAARPGPLDLDHGGDLRRRHRRSFRRARRRGGSGDE